MEVQLKGNTNRRFHLPSDIADLLLLWPGSPIEVVPPPAPKKLEPKTTWVIGYRYGNRGPSDRPSIQAHCDNCKLTLTFEGPTAHKTGNNKFWHCGVGEEIPKDIAKTYERLWRQREPQQRPQQTGDAVRRLHGLVFDRAGDPVNPSGNYEYVGDNPPDKE